MTLTEKHQLIKTNGVKLHLVQAGPNDGPLVVLLHGFPEYWRSWRYQIPYLAERGYWVWAPDQRGYNLSDKPIGVSAYNLDILVDDVVGLIEAAGRKRCFLVAHDWGAAIAWWLARLFPERLERMTILNAPHGAVMANHLHRNASQKRRSWYMYFFQLPWIPETLLRANNWKPGTMALEKSSRPGTFSNADLARYRQTWSRPGAMTAMINWYRALNGHKPTRLAGKRVKVPTLLLWGAQDIALGREMAQPASTIAMRVGWFSLSELATGSTKRNLRQSTPTSVTFLAK